MVCSLCKYVGILTVCLLSIVLFTSNAIAAGYNEEFNGTFTHPEDWYITQGDGSITFSIDSIQLLRSENPSNAFPFIVNRNNIFPESSELSIEIKFRFINSGNFGDGIVLYSDIGPRIDILGIWQDHPTKLVINSPLCNADNSQCGNILFSSSTADFSSHTILVNRDSGGSYSIFIDDLSTPVFISKHGYPFPNRISFGNDLVTNTIDYWTSFEIDYLHINSSSPKVSNSTIIIPGFGGSWNYSAILGRSGGEEWRVPDWIDTYDNLVNSLVAAGYTKDKDLFVFGYDWRKSFVDLAADLDSFIADLRSQGKISADTGINLVSHSYGGLIMNQYLRNNSSQTINKALSLGSPYRGVYQAYLAWAGGIFELPVWWQKAGAEVVIQVNKAGGDSNADVIRRMMPSIRDMLPLYPFIEYRGVVTKTKIGNPNLESLYQYLKEEQKPAIIAGNGFATIETVKVMPASTKERKAGLWPDGKPYHTIKSDEGDDTVLVKSSQGLINTQVVNHNHGGLVTDKAALETILSELGLDGSKATALPYQPSDKAILAVLQSPGVLQITKEGGLNPDEVIYDPSGKLAMLPGYDEGIFTIMVKNNGEYGRYRLLLGYITTDSSSWKTFKGELTEGDSDNYRLKLDNGISDFTTDEIEERPFGAWLEELRISVEGWMPVAGRSAALAWIKTIKGSPDKWRLNELREAKNKLHAIWVMARDNEQSETKYLTEITLVLADRQFAGESKTDFWQMKNRYLSQLAVLKKISNNIDRREEYGLAIKTAVEAEALRESNRTKAAELYYSAYLWLKDI